MHALALLYALLAPLISAPASAPASAPVPPLLSVPEGALEPLMERLDDPKGGPAVVVHYGDSHSATGWLADAIIKALIGEARVSPGFVALGFPRDWTAKVTRAGRWDTQNWLLGKAKGPFGPLGVARVTRDPSARMRLKLLNPPKAQGAVTVRAFFDPACATLPFRLDNHAATLARFTPDPKLDVGCADPTDKGESKGEGQDAGVEADPPVGVLTITPTHPDEEITLAIDCEDRRCPKGGQLRFYGFQVDYAEAVMSWDVLAVGGTTLRNPLYRGGPDQRGYLRQRAPQLFMLFYGTNSTSEQGFELERYRQKQVELIRYLKATAPQATCLILGLPDRATRDADCFMDRAQRRALKKPRKRRSHADWARLKAGREARICDPDRLIKGKGKRARYPVPGIKGEAQWLSYKEACRYRTMPRVFEIAAVQRQVAAEEGCMFFDTLRFMGGADSIQSWTCADPAKAQADLLHLSELGYRILGAAIGEALNEAMGRAGPEGGAR
ncbi:hypothetical protein KKF91_11120 [Myxococcota bacterium]|nr:hypothetical protein [Myxococcota bacterium]